VLVVWFSQLCRSLSRRDRLRSIFAAPYSSGDIQIGTQNWTEQVQPVPIEGGALPQPFVLTTWLDAAVKGTTKANGTTAVVDA
jgi:hypothetical protein